MTELNRIDEYMSEEDSGFRIDSDQKAEWALGKIREAKAEQEKWVTYYTERIEAIRKETQNTIEFMTDHLHLYFQGVPHKKTKGGTEKYALPSGELIRKPAGLDYERDDMALLAWCEEHLPEAVKVTRKAGWSEVKAYIKETGEIPDGVKPFETLPTFSIKEA